MQGEAEGPGRQYKLLVDRVFRTTDGMELLKHWRLSHVEVRTVRENPYDTTARAAVKDFVTDIDSIMREVSQWSS